jgi:hypothetical protein
MVNAGLHLLSVSRDGNNITQKIYKGSITIITL